MADAFDLFQIICLWFQADKLECQCSYHHDAEYGEGKAQVAAIRALTHHLCNHGSGKYAHHIHDTVCCGSVLCRDNLAEDWSTSVMSPGTAMITRGLTSLRVWTLRMK